jgi:DNA-binding NtrC family response regulator
VIQKSLIFNRGAPITPEDINQAISEKNHTSKAGQEKMDELLRQLVRRELLDARKNMFDSCMDLFAAILISEALNLTGGNRSRASKLLGLSRPTLHSKIEKYGLKLETSVR